MLEWFLPYTVDVKKKYDLPDNFFLISNQFWIHKDHFTAFNALNAIKSKSDVVIVCTGVIEDYRRPNYAEEINQYLASNGLTERVKMLGHIPKRDQIEILKNSIALVQPTLFEGGPGGGCVYDAVSLGVPVILSDIPVNLEVVADNIWFFKAEDSIDLAEKMSFVLRTNIHRTTQEALLKMGQLNLEKLGDRLLEAISSVV